MTPIDDDLPVAHALPAASPLVGAAVLIQVLLVLLVVLSGAQGLAAPAHRWLGAVGAGLLLQVAAYHRWGPVRAPMTGAVLVALGWGLGPGIGVAGDPELQLRLLPVLALVAASQLGLLSAAPPRLFYLTLGALFAPFALGAVLSPAPWLGAVAAALAAGLAWAASGLYRALAAWARLREQNQALIRDLVQQKETAEQANVAKSRFLAAASHDLRQPLHALSLFATALADRIRYPEVRRIVDNIMASVAALEGLFNSLLDISKLDAGALKPDIGSIPLQTLFSRLDNDYRPQARAKGLAWDLHPCPGVVVRSDPALLERMLRNLVANAIRYTERGSVTVACAPADHGVQITVRDTGVGIAPENREMIFGEYVQLGNPERDRSKGLGLGLAIVDRIARLLDHSLTMESERGQGSCFTVVLPPGDPAELESPAEEGPMGAERELDGLVVLVIDDESAIREAVRVLVEGWGARVLGVDSLEGACEALAGECVPDCVLADYRLRQGHTGVEALQELERRLARRLPAVIITGDVALTREYPDGIDGYRILHKPLRPARLRAFLRHAVGRKRGSAQPHPN